MFTGLIEALGTVGRVEAVGASRRLVLVEPSISPHLAIGESVAVNGVCLTVVERLLETFSFDVGPETLLRTNLGELAVGDVVNLERSLRVGDRLGGHLVQGHVDGIGTIATRKQEGEGQANRWELVRFQCPADIAMQTVSKGSITVDGISLTVVDSSADGFSVALIPHTLAVTTLGRKPPGATVNLETDVLAKYVWKCLNAR
jgi:riboflavin synthase